jgi:hypothetical protein
MGTSEYLSAPISNIPPTLHFRILSPVLLWEGQAGEACNIQTQQCSLGCMEALEKKKEKHFS